MKAHKRLSLHRSIPSILCWIPLVALLAAHSFATDTFTWTSAKVGGGGYITGLIIHPMNGNLMYARTDVGGAYRWDSSASAWVPLTDWITSGNGNLYGIESFALDPSNTNIVYLACGKDMNNSPHGIYKSTDRGATWTGPYLTTVPMGGNDNIVGGRASPFLRNAGERLQVDPNKNNILYFGSRSDGLWKSSDSGVTWTKQTIPNQGAAGYGVSFVAFDETSSSQGTACTRIYIGICGTSPTGTDGGVYKSTNTGSTWTELTGANVNQPRRGQCSPADGTLWVTHERGVAKCTAAGTALTDATPSQATSVVYNALALDPSNASKAVVMRGGPVYNNAIYKTTDGGGTWSAVGTSHTSTVPWWTSAWWSAWPSAMVINPANTTQAWYGDWFGVWKTDNYTVASPTWSNFENGHEEIVTFTLRAPPAPSVDLLSGAADVGGFRHNNGPNGYPSATMGSFQAIFGLDYCEANPNFVVSGEGSQSGTTHGVRKSTDNCVSSVACSGWTATDMPRRVAVSSTTTNIFVVGISGGKPKRTGNSGTSFTVCAGILENGPVGPWETSQPLCADKVDGNKFYYFVSGKLYRSTDGGQNFTAVKTGLLTSSRANLRAVPGVNGEIWLSLDSNGLWKSTDSGVTFTEVLSPGGARITARSIGFGKQASGSVPWLYSYGTVDGVEGVHLSKNRGSTWTHINTSAKMMGDGPNIMEPSRQTAGRVYLGTGGRGIFQGNGDLPSTPTGVGATAGNNQVTLSWNAVSNADKYNVKRSTTSGGPYTTIASPTSPGYTDPGLFNGTTYYYVISAVNDYGESANSSQVSATPVAPVPAPFVAQDIGAVGVAGTASYSAGTYTVNGSGVDIYSTADSFQYVYRSWTGDVEVVSRVVSQENTHAWAKAGVMVRADLTAGSVNAFMTISPTSGSAFQIRSTAGGTTDTSRQLLGPAAPYWVKVVRSGSMFAGFVSSDGASWVQVGTATNVTMGAVVYVGLAVSAHNNTTLNTSTFDNFTVDEPWTSDDVGAVGVAGGASVNPATGVFTVDGSGDNIYGTADAFHFVDTPLYGNGQIVARVASVENTHFQAKAAVMIRQNLTAGSAHATVSITPGYGIEFLRRTTSGGTTTNTVTSGLVAPYWLRLDRTGTTFTASRSPDGSAWTTIGTHTISMTNPVYVGLAVCSHTNTFLCTGVFDNVTVTPSP
jgi:xyloglucan-specific exo-beta-1,4-glucanase